MVVNKIELNEEGVSELLKSQEMLSYVSQLAGKAVGALGNGYEYDTQIGKSRVNADVHAVTRKAHREALDNNTIYKAVFGC